MHKNYYVYILTNYTNKVLYIGVTNNLERRTYEHKFKEVDGFSSEYDLKKLVYFEETNSIDEALYREKQLKGWRRSKKINLIRKTNPSFQDLAANWFEENSLQNQDKS